MTSLLVRLQITTWMRDRFLRGLLVTTVLLLTLASVWATATDAARRHAQVEAANTARAHWVDRGADHPHRRAHFGDFTFRPAGPLARLDRGVQAQLGKVLRMEAHRQGTPLHSDASRAGTVARFPRLDVAFLIQMVVPLLLIFLGATGLSAERQGGQLRLSLVQGASARSIAAGHFFALWGLGIGLITAVVVTSLATSMILDGLTTLPWARLAGFALVHALFLAVVAAGVVAAAVWSRSARSALFVLLATWVVASALLPRATASVASTLHPLPSQDEFQAEMRAAREAGPDAHNPHDPAVIQRKQELMQEYGVTSIEALPIDFTGITMQMDEEFGNGVWDVHYGALREKFQRQGDVLTQVALLNPFQAVDHISMALTGRILRMTWISRCRRKRFAAARAPNHEHPSVEAGRVGVDGTVRVL